MKRNVGAKRGISGAGVQTIVGGSVSCNAGDLREDFRALKPSPDGKPKNVVFGARARVSAHPYARDYT